MRHSNRPIDPANANPLAPIKPRTEQKAAAKWMRIEILPKRFVLHWTNLSLRKLRLLAVGCH
jgi:hypothetical protein